MTIDAQEIAKAIGLGVAEALNTSSLFLGIEEGEVRNPEIRPEYVTTVEVAKKFTAPERYVTLETPMKMLRERACSEAWLRTSRQKDALQKIDSVRSKYKFGRKDSQRLDFVVWPADKPRPPLLIAEAKLGVDNFSGLKRDIDRLVRLLTMYQKLRLLEPHKVYAAVLFDSMDEGNTKGTASAKAEKLLRKISGHLEGVTQKRKWLKAQAGLLTHGVKVETISVYPEYHSDGTQEHVFAKDGFTFAPGLVLLGNVDDVDTVKF